MNNHIQFSFAREIFCTRRIVRINYSHVSIPKVSRLPSLQQLKKKLYHILLENYYFHRKREKIFYVLVIKMIYLK